jgi:hypothetical protein
MLVDSFLFNDEVDLAAARLKYLSPVVDYFVVGEASLDHAGNQKPFHWLENSDVFANLNDKILRVEICEKDLASDVEHVFGIPDRAIGQNHWAIKADNWGLC